ncbi:MAG: hypothetical protein EOP06_10725 [Proteobacteria bacterium]|nr:MAG: hypothetical protein EOP06_10725 [Pseudomonadota bacterium]
MTTSQKLSSATNLIYFPAAVAGVVWVIIAYDLSFWWAALLVPIGLLLWWYRPPSLRIRYGVLEANKGSKILWSADLNRAASYRFISEVHVSPRLIIYDSNDIEMINLHSHVFKLEPIYEWARRSLICKEDSRIERGVR